MECPIDDLTDREKVRIQYKLAAPWKVLREDVQEARITSYGGHAPLVINIVSMHRSIITIRSNTRRPCQARRLSGVSFPIITPKGLPPPWNSTWGCTTFNPLYPWASRTTSLWITFFSFSISPQVFMTVRWLSALLTICFVPVTCEIVAHQCVDVHCVDTTGVSWI